jgi:hypothetical protein
MYYTYQFKHNESTIVSDYHIIILSYYHIIILSYYHIIMM